jgi:hypothetical protein
METTTIEIPVISFADFKQAYRKALVEWLKDEDEGPANTILLEGVPKMDEDSLTPFIKWAFMRLETELPDRYFVKTHNGIWAISLDDCIVWSSGYATN